VRAKPLLWYLRFAEQCLRRDCLRREPSLLELSTPTTTLGLHRGPPLSFHFPLPTPIHRHLSASRLPRFSRTTEHATNAHRCAAILARAAWRTLAGDVMRTTVPAARHLPHPAHPPRPHPPSSAPGRTPLAAHHSLATRAPSPLTRQLPAAAGGDGLRLPSRAA